MDSGDPPKEDQARQSLPPLFQQIIENALDRLTTQGLDVKTAANARASMFELVALVNRYGIGAIVAVGMLEGILDQLGGDLSALVASKYQQNLATELGITPLHQPGFTAATNEAALWVAECVKCGTKYPNHAGSTPCCGSVANVVSGTVQSTKPNEQA